MLSRKAVLKMSKWYLVEDGSIGNHTKQRGSKGRANDTWTQLGHGGKGMRRKAVDLERD